MSLMTTANARIADCNACTCPECCRYYGDSTSEDWDDDESEANATHLAAHCCLWKRFDHAARTRIAERVEGGANWLDAMEAEHG